MSRLGSPPLNWGWWGRVLPWAQLGLCLPSQNPGPRCCLWPTDARGHRAPILGAGLGLGQRGWWVARCLSGGQLPRCGGCQAVASARTRTRTPTHPGRAGPDEEGCILHTYINTVQRGKLVGRGLCRTPEGPVPVMSVGSFVSHVWGSPGGRCGGSPS